MPENGERLRELAALARVELAAIRRYQRAGIIGATEVEVTETTVRRVRRAHRLRRDLGLQLDVIAIIVGLIDRLEGAPRA